MPNTIFDYYKSQGKTLPSLTTRFKDPTFAAAAAKAGISEADYLKAGTNNADYNNRIAAALTETTNAPGNIKGTLPPAGTNPDGSSTDTAANTPLGDLSNLRLALRSALNEGVQKRSADRFTQLAGAGVGVGTTPGSIGSVVSLIRNGAQTQAADIFDTISKTLEEQQKLKATEMESINKLRAEYGSLIPAGVTSLSQALTYIEPAVDQERKLKIAKMQKDANGGAGGGTLYGISLTSPNTSAVLNGIASIDQLTPTEQGKVRADLNKLGFGDETAPEWFTKQVATQNMMSPTPAFVQTKWSTTRQHVLFGSSNIDETFFTKLYGPEQGTKIWGQSKGVIDAYHSAGFTDAQILKLMQGQ